MIKIEAGFAPVVPLTHSRIGYDSITRTGTVTASSAQAGFPASAAANPLTYEFWRPEAAGDHWEVDAGEAVLVDFVGIAAHTLGDGATVEIQYSTDGTAFTTADSVTPTNNAPIMFLFEPVEAQYWRIVVLDVVASVGVIYVGKVLEMERACYAGLSPIDLSRRTTIRPNISEGGQWLGRSIIREGSAMSVGFRHLNYDWYLENFDPFVEQAREYPFFFAWRPEGYPESVGYVWVNQDITPTTMGIRKFLEVNFDMEGLSIE